MTEMNEYIQLSHNDLDGAGCAIVIQSKFYVETTIHSNYNDIVNNLQNIDSIVTNHTKAVFITDLNFDEKCFVELVRVASHHPHTKFVYVDHHPYEGRLGKLLERIKEVENISVHHTTEICATKICFQMIKSNDEDLSKFVDWVDSFDVWRQDSPLFDTGWVLNTIFWEIKMSGFKYNIQSNNYKIPKYFFTMYNDLMVKKEKMYKGMEANNLFVREGDIMVAFSDGYKTFFQIDFPEYKVHILPFLSSNNISVRISSTVNNSEKLKEDILALVNGYPNLVSAGGHPYAFGITIKKEAPKDDVIGLIQKIMEISQLHIDTN